MGDGRKVEVPTIKHENTITDRHGEQQGSLVGESPVHVLPEQRLSHGWECINLQQSQTLLESVVDFDLALPTHDNHTTRTAL